MAKKAPEATPEAAFETLEAIPMDTPQVKPPVKPEAEVKPVLANLSNITGAPREAKPRHVETLPNGTRVITY